MDKIEKIRQEIERQIGYAKNTNYPKGSIENERATAIIAVCLDILSFLDSLLTQLGKRALKQKDLELGYLDLKAYTTGTSQCLRRGLVARLIPHLLPFSI